MQAKEAAAGFNIAELMWTCCIHTHLNITKLGSKGGTRQKPPMMQNSAVSCQLYQREHIGACVALTTKLFVVTDPSCVCKAESKRERAPYLLTRKTRRANTSNPDVQQVWVGRSQRSPKKVCSTCLCCGWVGRWA